MTQHGAGLEPQPATGREVGERLVDRLAGGADELGELFLGEVVGHQDALLDRAPEAGRQVEQRLGHPAGDVREDQVGEVLVGAAQALGERGEQHLGDGGTTREQAVEVLVADAEQLGLGHGGGGHGAGTGVEQAQLAEHLARAEDRHEVLAAVAAAAAELHLALTDHVEAVALVSLGEEHVAPLEARLGHRLHQRRGRLLVEGREQRGSSHHVVIHGRQCATSSSGPTRRLIGCPTPPESLPARSRRSP